jgi:hypothetical protein
MLALVTLCVFTTSARAHRVVDFIITSSEEAGGQLLIALYDVRGAVVPVNFSATTGEIAVYTGTNPGFNASNGDEFYADTGRPVPIMPPDVPVHVVLVDDDGGRTGIKIGGTLLTRPGDSGLIGTAGPNPPGDLHKHPEWMLLGPDNEFAEGRIVFKLATTAPGYSDSPTYVLRVSNGHLPPTAFAADAYDRRSVACHQAVGTAVESYQRVVYGALRRCLDAILVERARTTAGIDTSRAGGVARACTGAAGQPDASTMLGKVTRAADKAFAAIRRRCGADGSGDFSDKLVRQHLGLVKCRVEETAGASYYRARTLLEQLEARPSQGGGALSEHFSCVPLTAGEQEVPSNLTP